MSARSHPKISVCLPVFNGEPFLRAAIESVLNQTYENFELLISDDCSQDGSPELLSEFSRLDKRIKVWRNEINQGLFANYNACIRRASGALLKFFAQDDLLHERMLEEVAEVFALRPDVVLVSTGKVLIDADGKDISSSQCAPRTPVEHFEGQTSLAGPDVIRHCVMLPENMIGEPTSVTIRSICSDEGFDQSFYHLGDLEYWLRVLLQGNYVYLPQRLCSFRQHAKARTVTNTQNLLFIPDISRLAKEFSWLLDGPGQQELSDNTVKWLAQHAAYLAETQQLDIEPLRDKEACARSIMGAQSGDHLKDPMRDRLISDLLEFREVALTALNKLGSTPSSPVQFDPATERYECLGSTPSNPVQFDPAIERYECL